MNHILTLPSHEWFVSPKGIFPASKAVHLPFPKVGSGCLTTLDSRTVSCFTLTCRQTPSPHDSYNQLFHLNQRQLIHVMASGVLSDFFYICPVLFHSRCRFQVPILINTQDSCSLFQSLMSGVRVRVNSHFAWMDLVILLPLDFASFAVKPLRFYHCFLLDFTRLFCER